MAEKSHTDHTDARGRSLCWNCESEINTAFFCSNCVKVQPVSHESDYFSVFGLPRKLSVDLTALESKFHELSRKLHPDFYQGKTETEKVFSLDNSAVVNTAYRTLKNPLQRMEYLVKLEEGASKEIPKKAPQDLLGEMLELQETLQEYKSLKGGSDLDRAEPLRTSLIEALKRLTERLSRDEERAEVLFGKWDALLGKDRMPDAAKRELLDQMKDILSNRSYLERVIEDIQEEVG